MSEPVEHLSCQEVVELVNDYLEQALGVEEAAAFEQHLNFCDGCAWYLEQIRTTVATVGRIREEEVPSETKDRLMAAFREWRRS